MNMTDPDSVFELLFTALPSLCDHHGPDSPTVALLRHLARQEVERAFASEQAVARAFGPFGPLKLPYHSMGAVDSVNLFDLDELIIFSFYWANRQRYKKVLDIGANIGLHSIILARCGFEVRAFEPDPTHFELLRRNLELNAVVTVEPVNAAVSNTAGEAEFVRVLGNTTGSHISGSKADPYGDLQRFPVPLVDIRELMGWADFMKIDAEGHEREILLATSGNDWHSTDAIIEISNDDNARAVFDHLRGEGVRLFAQRCAWREVTNRDKMPTSYRHGSLFATMGNRVPWP